MSSCLLCGRNTQSELTLKQILVPGKLQEPISCEQCRSSFEPIEGLVCDGCGCECREQRCTDCNDWLKKYGELINNQAMFKYNDAMKSFMEAYKFNGDFQLRRVFSTQLSELICAFNDRIVMPIPVNNRSRLTRGFNQVSAMFNERVQYQDLISTIETTAVAQSHKTRRERLSASQPFMISEQDGRTLNGQNVLLVDDVYTTGRTMYYAYEVIKRFKPISIKSITLAR